MADQTEQDILRGIQHVLNHRIQPPHPPLPSAPSAPGIPSTPTTAPKLGASYNIFDGEELLEQSIRSIRPLVSYVNVVYQTHSNFNEPCSVDLVPTLQELQHKGLIDEIIPYDTQFNFTKQEKKHWVSARATGSDLGGARYTNVADPFFNELKKRELGRLACQKQACTHFMSMDTDEYYKQQELQVIWHRMMQQGYDCAVCKMRFFFKFPRCELLPKDDNNYVTAIFKVDPDMPLRLAHPYANLLIDPTRRMFGATQLLVCTRNELEMYHYSFVRLNIAKKIMNVTNRGNYNQHELNEFIQRFPKWTQGLPVVHPHPYFKETFQTTRMVPNWFNIDVGDSLYNWERYTTQSKKRKGTGEVTGMYSVEQSNTLKQSAAEHFKHKNYTDAGDLYYELSTRGASTATQGESSVSGRVLNPRLAYLMNSATCCLKRKKYGQALDMCTKALANEEKFIQSGAVDRECCGVMTDGMRAKAWYTKAYCVFETVCTEKDPQPAAATHNGPGSTLQDTLDRIKGCIVEVEQALQLQQSTACSKLLKKLKRFVLSKVVVLENGGTNG